MQANSILQLLRLVGVCQIEDVHIAVWHVTYIRQHERPHYYALTGLPSVEQSQCRLSKVVMRLITVLSAVGFMSFAGFSILFACVISIRVVSVSSPYILSWRWGVDVPRLRLPLRSFTKALVLQDAVQP